MKLNIKLTFYLYQASCFGCGCWAQKPVENNSHSTAVSTTGCGEHLVRTFLARECGLALSTSDHPLEDLQKVMKEKFAESVFLTGVPEKLGGAICLQVTTVISDIMCILYSLQKPSPIIDNHSRKYNDLIILISVQ